MALSQIWKIIPLSIFFNDGEKGLEERGIILEGKICRGNNDHQ